MKKINDKYIGKTKGPASRDSTIGDAISNLKSNLKEMVDFVPIEGKIEQTDEVLLENADQRYAFHLAMGIQKGRAYLEKIYGKIPPAPSDMHEARWLNTASHEMREYVQNENPEENLTRVVGIIVNWYLPMFFLIKKKPHITNAAKHFFQGIVWAREYFTQEELDLVEKCFCTNSFMAHPESILLAGICDENQAVRVKCAEIIIDARNRDDGEIRHYYPPNQALNLKANTYLEMVDLRLKSLVTAPPLLRNYDNQSLYELAKQGKIDIPNIPCHSVNNERAVQDTSRAAKNSIGPEKTHGHILNLSQNRETIPTRYKKDNFVSKK